MARIGVGTFPASVIRALRGGMPAWLRVTQGESRWPVAVAMVVAIGLQLVLPDRFDAAIALAVARFGVRVTGRVNRGQSGRFNRESTALRIASLVLAGLRSAHIKSS